MTLQDLLNTLEDDTMYLIDINNLNKRLPIKFNPKINSFKTTILESKIDTIGSQYPIFFRNGQVKYQEIGISGLISYWMTNPNNEFMLERDIFGVDTMSISERTETESINKNNYTGRSINLTYENIQAERRFRNAVYTWLTNGQPKIFISPVEGEFVVRLMNVSLSPNDTLGRMLYTFSCTGYECGNVNEVLVNESNNIS